MTDTKNLRGRDLRQMRVDLAKRLGRHVTLRELAAQLGVHPQTVTFLENEHDLAGEYVKAIARIEQEATA